MTQDEAGYIWLGTDNGLSRFDGINFKNYSLEQLGLKSYISSLATTKDGNIIFGSGSEGIFRFNPLTNQVKCLTKQTVSRSNKLIIQGNLLVSLHENRGFDFISIESGEPLFGDTVLMKNCLNKALSMVTLRDGTILLSHLDGLYKLIDGKQIKIRIATIENKPVYSIFEDKNSLLLGSEGAIFRIQNNKVVETIDIPIDKNKIIRNILVDKRNNIWFNNWGSKDIYLINHGTLYNISETIGNISGTITGILSEINGVIFVSTISKGIYLFNNNQFLVYPESYNLPNANIHKIIKTKQGGLLMGTIDGLAYLDPSGQKIKSIRHIPDRTEYVRDITEAYNNFYLVATVDNKFANSLSSVYNCEFENIKIRYSHCSALWADSHSVVTGNWDNKLVEYSVTGDNTINSKEAIFQITHNINRINCLNDDYYGRMWIGSHRGLCIINQEGEKYLPKGAFQNEEIFEITKLPGDNILVVSNLGFYTFQNDKVEQNISVLFSKKIRGVNCVELTGQNEFLIGTNHGLIFMKNGKSKLMNTNDGILSDNINDILYSPNQFIAWVATSEGLMQVDLKALRNGKSPSLEIKEVIMHQDNQKWRPSATTLFEYNKNSFSISFQAFHYDNPEKIKYQYKIDNTEWLPAPANEIQIASMEPGNHHVLLRAGLQDGIWGPSERISVTINPPFYRTWWFYLITSLCGITLIYFFIKKQLRIHKAKQDEKTFTERKIVELQQKALASSLNPHFIFNSLNAIQHFVNSKNSLEANDYLAKFARLMRMQLNMAEKSSIILYDEILRLEFYLNLEQMRFSDRMTWSIVVDPEINQYKIEIPNMIIQPFVENSIWHGIMPSDLNGFIELQILTISDGGLEIIITDNGVGLNNPNKVASDHNSKGTQLIKQRLLLLDPATENVLTFENLAPGTRVRILLSAKIIDNVKFLDSVTL